MPSEIEKAYDEAQRTLTAATDVFLETEKANSEAKEAYDKAWVAYDKARRAKERAEQPEMEKKP